jgi:hypothetical protein
MLKIIWPRSWKKRSGQWVPGPGGEHDRGAGFVFRYQQLAEAGTRVAMWILCQFGSPVSSVSGNLKQKTLWRPPAATTG